MNIQSVTNRYLRTLTRMKGKLEADLSTVTKTLKAFGGLDAIPTHQMSAAHRKSISRGIRKALRARKAK